MSQVDNDTVKTVMISFIERAKQIGIKGVKRDAAALECLVGMHLTLCAMGVDYGLGMHVQMTALRGYSWFIDCTKDEVKQ